MAKSRPLLLPHLSHANGSISGLYFRYPCAQSEDEYKGLDVQIAEADLESAFRHRASLTDKQLQVCFGDRAMAVDIHIAAGTENEAQLASLKQRLKNHAVSLVSLGRRFIDLSVRKASFDAIACGG